MKKYLEINRKLVCTSLIANSFAISISVIVGILYSSLRYHWINKEKENIENHENLKWYDYIITFLVSFMTAAISYWIVYILIGYLPMSRAQFV